MTHDDPVVGYVRVSTGEQGTNGGGLDAQRAAIRAECDRRGWRLVRIYEDVASGKTRKGRTGLEQALDACETGQATAMIVAKLDRLSRSMIDFATLIERAAKKKWSIVALDVGVDTTTATGEMIAHVLASLAQWERRLISERTRSALAAKKAAGVRLGRPGQVSGKLRVRIAAMRQEGLSAERIADTLNVEGVPTARNGARWYPSTVRTVLRATEAAR